MRFTVTFEESRVGRRHDIEPQMFDTGGNADPWGDLAGQVHKRVRGWLSSRDYEVAVNTETGRVIIGDGRFARGRAQVEPEGAGDG